MNPDIMTERVEIAQQLENFRHRDGKLNVPKVMEEVYIQSVLHTRKLDEGRQIMNRCPVLKGEMTWKQAYSNAWLRWIKHNPKTFMGIIIVIIALVLPSSVAAGIIHIGGLP